MYFYLGCLIIQLMKIKLALAIVGAGYSYCLMILRSSFSSIDENEYPVLEDQPILIQIDSQQLANTSNSGSITEQFLIFTKELQLNNSNLSNMLLERVKKYLEGNFELVAIDHNFIIDALPQETINNLRETAKLMVDAGLEKECADVYSSFRREWLEEFLTKKLLGLEKMGFQNYMIGRCIKASKVALRILFPSERRLCESVFSGISSASDLCFLEICRGAMTQLLSYADSFVDQSPSVWHLFKVLGVFETMRDLIPEFQSLFPDSLVNEAMKVKNRLGEVSRDTFMEFENLVFLHTPEAELYDWEDGGVHPMTCEVTGYFIQAFWSRPILDQVLREYPLVADGVGKSSSFSEQMERMMEQFEKELEAKSKIYKDPALRYFFIMNNLRQVESQLGTLGDDRFRENIGQQFELYYRSSWIKVLEFLKMDSNESMIDKLNLFNLHFKEMCSIQSTWRVFDEELRKQIIISLENELLPAYGNFIVRFEDVLGKDSDQYIDYGMSGIQDQLNRLFLQQWLKGKERSC